MTRPLFKNNSLAFRDGNLQIIPAGKNADDCICCGEPLPNCTLCTLEGGPFRRVDYETTISGFISTEIKYFDGPFSGNRLLTYIIEGLDILNGTYNYSTTNDCEPGILIIDFEINARQETRVHDEILNGSEVCSPLGVLQATHTFTTLRLEIRPFRIQANLLPNPPSGSGFGMFWLATSGFEFGVTCVDRSGSASNAFKAPPPPAPFNTFNVCNGFSNFTYSFATTVNGVP
jgi:hypothetical protein